MPLSPPVARKHIHSRAIECASYARDDGLWDIEGHLTDVKSYPFPNEFRGEIAAGEPIHDMWLRLTVDRDMTVTDVEARTDAGPFAVCPAINPAFRQLIGTRIAPGWRKVVHGLLGGVRGCTHLVDLLGPMATVAFHSVRWSRADPEKPRSGAIRPPVDTCHAWASDGDVIRTKFPDHYTGR